MDGWTFTIGNDDRGDRWDFDEAPIKTWAYVRRTERYERSHDEDAYYFWEAAIRRGPGKGLLSFAVDDGYSDNLGDAMLAARQALDWLIELYDPRFAGRQEFRQAMNELIGLG